MIWMRPPSPQQHRKRSSQRDTMKHNSMLLLTLPTKLWMLSMVCILSYTMAFSSSTKPWSSQKLLSFDTSSSLVTHGSPLLRYHHPKHNYHHQSCSGWTNLLQRTKVSSSSSSPVSSSTSLNMFMGSDGGILGIGTPELLTILLVGYFVLGPSELYKLTKEIGKFVQNFRTLGSDLTKSVESNLESQLQLDEIRKAQRELNDAFSFRRSINVDEDYNDDDGLLRTVDNNNSNSIAGGDQDVTTSMPDTISPTKKIRRRRVRRVTQPSSELTMDDNEDVDFNGMLDSTMTVNDWETPFTESTATVMEPMSLQRTETIATTNLNESPMDEAWASPDYTNLDLVEQQRFQAQLDVDAWNAQIMTANEEPQEQPQSPRAAMAAAAASEMYSSLVLTKIMERLSLLEEEKNAADALLQEEFRLRQQTEEKYYREKRQLLEDAVAEMQSPDYQTALPTMNSSSSSSSNNNNNSNSINNNIIA